MSLDIKEQTKHIQELLDKSKQLFNLIDTTAAGAFQLIASYKGRFHELPGDPKKNESMMVSVKRTLEDLPNFRLRFSSAQTKLDRLVDKINKLSKYSGNFDNEVYSHVQTIIELAEEVTIIQDEFDTLVVKNFDMHYIHSIVEEVAGVEHDG